MRVVPSLEMGGVEKTLISLLPRLKERGFEVKVCTLYRKDILAQEMEEKGIPVINIGMRARLDVDIKYLKGIFYLKHWMMKEGFHIVHTHLYRANTPGRIAAKLAQIPVVVANEHNVDEWKNFFQRSVDRALSRITDRIIAVSERVKKFYVEEVGIPPGRITVLYNGVDLERFDKKVNVMEKRKELGLPLHSIIVGSVGRLHPQKNYFNFIKAISLIVKKFSRVHFLLVGGGPLKERLKRFSRTLGLEEKISFLGERKDIEEIYPVMDIFVLSSDREGFPITILEAMACGLPVVATRVGGVEEEVEEGKTAFLVPPANSEALAEAITKLISSPSLRKEMGKKGKERVKLFRIEKMVERTEKLYRELLREKCPHIQ